MDKQQAIQIWKNLDISSCQMNFSCGGDSMDDYNFEFETNKGKKIDSDELTDYFDRAVFDNVAFYEASDGHYIGEQGSVMIELDDSDDDEEEHDFTYTKSATAEYSETETDTIEINLNIQQIEYIEKYVMNINGGDDSGEAIFNYKRDFIMTDEMQDIEYEIGQIVDDIAESHEFSCEGEQSDWFRYTTNEEGEELKIEDDKLIVQVSRTFSVYRDSDW